MSIARNFLNRLDALDCPDVSAGLLDGYVTLGGDAQRRLRQLSPARVDDLLNEAIAYRDCWRGAWEATPDGLAAWLILKENGE